jgi:uncharacterized protein YecT (DUF1311 family)
MNSSKMLWLVGLGAVGWTGAALGDTYRDTLLTREYHRCIKDDPSNAGWGQCLEREDDRQEGRLNQAYRMVMSRLPASRKTALLTSERTWVKTRKRECDRVYREMEGGTGDGPALLLCLSVRAAERTAWLERFR